MNELGQVDEEAVDIACREVFGAPIILRQRPLYGTLEVNIAGAWYACELSDFIPTEPQAFIESMKHVRERGKATA